MLLIDAAVFLLTLLATANAGVVKYDIVNKRDTTKYVQPITGGFAATIQVGNPPQDVQVGFDTGSFNLIVLAENLTCDEGSCPGKFNAADSSSARITNETFSFQYAGGDGAHGNILYDTVTIGGLEVPGAPVGYSYEETVDGYAVFGLGDRGSSRTPLKSMVSSGAISRKVFSTYTIPSGDGGIVFGGVDTAKYASLGTVPFSTNEEDIPYYVEVSAISSSCGPVTAKKFTTILDTGSDASIVPNDVFHEIHQSFRGKVASEPIADLPNPESYVFKCKDAHPLLVDFSGAFVEIPVQNFLLPLTSNGNPLLDEESDELCSTMIFNDLNHGMYVFGAHFLSGLYIVWDLDSKTLSLGNAIDTTEENIVELTDLTIPKAFTAPGSSNVVGVSTTNAETTTLTAESISYGFLTTSIAEDACTLAVESSSSTPTGFSFSLSSSSFASKLVVSTDKDGIITRHQSTTVTAQSATCLKCETSSSSSSSSSTVSTIIRSATATVTSFTCLTCTTISSRSSSASPSSPTTTLLPESSVSTVSSSSSDLSSVPAITSTSGSSLPSSPGPTSSSTFSKSNSMLSSSDRSSSVAPSSTASSLFTSNSESSYNSVFTTTKFTVVTTTSFTCLSCSSNSMIISSSSALPKTSIETDFSSSTLTSTITSCSEHDCSVSFSPITSKSSSEPSVETPAPSTLTSVVSSKISSASSFSTIAPKESTSYSFTEGLPSGSSYSFSSSASSEFSLVSAPRSSELSSTTVTTIYTITTDSVTNIITSTIVVPCIPTDTITASSIIVNTETTETTETNKTIETTNAEVTTGSTIAETIYSATQISESNPTNGVSSTLNSTELQPTQIDSTATQTSQMTITQTASASSTDFDTPAISTSTEDSSMPAVTTFEGSGNSLGISLLLVVAPFLL